jgi:MFS family permease
MNIATVLALTFTISGLLAVLTSIWLMIASLFPRFIRQAQSHCARPGKSLLIGLGVGLVPFIIGFLLSQPVPGRVLGWPIMFIVFAAALAGSAALAARIGSGMPSQCDRTDPWRRTLRGGIVLSFSFLLPLVGWFIWMPLALIHGAGVTFLTVRDIHRARKEEKEFELAEAEARAAEEREEAQANQSAEVISL